MGTIRSPSITRYMGAGMRIFVDCDDTLILYPGDGQHLFCVFTPWIAATKGWKSNEVLIARIRRFDGDVFIWSSGGREYAKRIARVLLPGVSATFLAKDKDSFRLVREGDIVVDDHHIPVGVKIFGHLETWEESQANAA